MLKRIMVIAVVALFGMAIIRLGKGPEKITAQMVVDKAHATMTFPVDLGDQMFVESIEAEGNAIVSTVSLRDLEIGSDQAMMAKVLTEASKSDSCREMQPMKDAFARSGLVLVKHYLDKNGQTIVRATITAADCGI